MEQTEITKLDPGLDSRTAAEAESTPGSSAVQQSAATPVLITEQRLQFGSAAALAPAPTRRWNPAHAIVTAVRAMFTRPEKPRPRPYGPRRDEFLEHAAMAREMRRL